MRIKKTYDDIYNEMIDNELKKYYNKVDKIESLKVLHMELWNPIYEKLITERIIIEKYDVEIHKVIPGSCIYCHEYDCYKCPFVTILDNNCNHENSWYDIYDYFNEYYHKQFVSNDIQYEKLKNVIWNILTVSEKHDED